MNISPKHDGHCYKNSNLQPAVAEEYQASKMGKLLLSAGDDSDIYLADKISIFGMDISTDGDTRGVNNFIRIQNQIIGEKADNMADNSPDVGHTIKCSNNALFDLKKNDKTLSGVDLLNSSRIKSINSDTRHILEHYMEEIKDKEESEKVEPRKKALKRFDTMILHHCGDHSQCDCEGWCSYRKVKNEHPEWNDEQVEAMAGKISTRPFAGKYMSLSPRGIASVQAKIRERFNEKTIDKIAKGGCTNLSESFWNMLIKFSEGKRLNLDLTDLWEVMCKLTFCRVGEGNIERTHDKVSDKLGLPINSKETAYLKKEARKRRAAHANEDTPAAKKARQIRKMTNAVRTDRIDPKKAHKTERMSLTDNVKSTVAKANRKPPSCSCCRLPGHTKKKCIMPEKEKQTTDLVNFDLEMFRKFDSM